MSNDSPVYNPSAHVDVCLLLEGTYPYVRGGVSTWVKQLIEGMPDLSFSIIFIGANPGDYDKPAYTIPQNLRHIEIHYIMDSDGEPEKKNKFFSRKADKSALFERSKQLHNMLTDSEQQNTTVPREVIRDFTNLTTGKDAITRTDLFHTEDAWNAIREKYVDAPEGLDFNHFFWTIRTMHGPLFTLAKIADNAPSATMYHAVSTGYAGYLGAMLKSKTGAPYIISEHGIYTKEREIDLAHVDWIVDEHNPFKVGLDENMGYLRQTWIRFFRSLGRMSYSAADHIYTLYNGNRLRQIEDGCPESLLTIIPNGVSVKALSTIRRANDAPVPPVLALIGRIVPIKDIKSFIRAMQIITVKVPDAKAWLVGPEEEDPAYVAECKALVTSLNLDDSIQFLEFQNLMDIFPNIGITVLTSVSEGQPLTTLESFAAGIPCVTTDVGSCRELIYGDTEEDREIGAAGAVVPIANPTALAETAIPLLTNIDKWREARDAAINRVEKYYDEKHMLSRYHSIYKNNIASSTAQTAGSQTEPAEFKQAGGL